MFAGTSIKRVGRDRFLRNVLVAIGNAPPQPELVAAARRCLDEAAPLVRATAVWAFGRLVAPDDIGAEATIRIASETDPMVLAEWQQLQPAPQTAAQ